MLRNNFSLCAGLSAVVAIVFSITEKISSQYKDMNVHYCIIVSHDINNHILMKRKPCVLLMHGFYLMSSSGPSI